MLAVRCHLYPSMLSWLQNTSTLNTFYVLASKSTRALEASPTHRTSQNFATICRYANNLQFMTDSTHFSPGKHRYMYIVHHGSPFLAHLFYILHGILNFVLSLFCLLIDNVILMARDTWYWKLEYIHACDISISYPCIWCPVTTTCCTTITSMYEDFKNIHCIWNIVHLNNGSHVTITMTH